MFKRSAKSDSDASLIDCNGSRLIRINSHVWGDLKKIFSAEELSEWTLNEASYDTKAELFLAVSML